MLFLYMQDIFGMSVSYIYLDVNGNYSKFSRDEICHA